MGSAGVCIWEVAGEGVFLLRDPAGVRASRPLRCRKPSPLGVAAS